MSHVPLSTMAKLASMTVEDIDPAMLRVATRLPSSLEPRPLGVKVLLDITGSKKATHEEFILEAATDAADVQALAAQERSGTRLWVYRLSSADVVRLRQIMERSSNSKASSVSIAAGVEACHRVPLGRSALPTTTFLRTNGAGYFVVTEDLDLRTVVPEAELKSKVPACV